MNILVSGVNGFVGKHLSRELHGRGHTVIGASREENVNPEIKKILSGYYVCDLTDPKDVSELPLDEVTAVINLAGLAKVGDSFKNPEIYNQINVGVLAVIGRQLVEKKSHARIIAVSTGAVYDPLQPMPLSEDSSISMENSPYALSKLLMEQTAEQLRADGLDCIVVRPFNHIGPGQEPGFLLPDLYEKISRALKSNEVVEVGNLKTKRDYTDVRDVVRAYADLAEADVLDNDLYNVCSGKSITGEQILEQILNLMDAKDKVEIKINQAFIRVNDPMDLFGSNSRLRQETGWEPQIKIEQTIKDFVESKSG
jgi:GDP-4-dehydro-6-deoxy-D-mannose reductase